MERHKKFYGSKVWSKKAQTNSKTAAFYALQLTFNLSLHLSFSHLSFMFCISYLRYDPVRQSSGVKHLSFSLYFYRKITDLDPG